MATPKEVAQRVADDCDADLDEILEAAEVMAECTVPTNEIERTLREKYTSGNSSTDGPGDEALETLGGYAAGDAVAVRGDDFLVAGVIETVNDEEAADPEECLISIDDPVVWRLTDARAEEIDPDMGPPLSYRYDDDRGKGSPSDWDGPKVTVGISHSNDDRVLRLPEPVHDTNGVRYYMSQEVGAVTDISVGGIVDPRSLLEADERPPASQGVTR